MDRIEAGRIRLNMSIEDCRGEGNIEYGWSGLKILKRGRGYIVGAGVAQLVS